MKQYLPAGICACGKIHTASVREVITGSGAALRIPDCISLLDAKKPFLFADANTWKAAGAGVGRILSDAGISFSRHVFSGRVEPDETAVGSMCMHFDRSCDLIITVVFLSTYLPIGFPYSGSVSLHTNILFSGSWVFMTSISFFHSSLVM